MHFLSLRGASTLSLTSSFYSPLLRVSYFYPLSLTLDSDRIAEYDMKLMDIDSDTLGIPDTDYEARVTLPSNEFTRIVRDLSQLGESVRIEVSKEGVRFASEGEAANGSVLLKQSENAVGSSSSKKAKTKTVKAEGEQEEEGEGEGADEDEGTRTRKMNVKKEKEGDGDVEMNGDDDAGDEEEFKPQSDEEGEDEQDKDEDENEEDGEGSGKKRKKKVCPQNSYLWFPFSDLCRLPYRSPRPPNLPRRLKPPSPARGKRNRLMMKEIVTTMTLLVSALRCIRTSH